MREFTAEKLKVKVFDSRDEMGKNAAHEIKERFLALLAQKDKINVIFAAAPSQNEALKYLASDKSIPWNRINAYHMDEYVGLPADAVQGFGNFLKAHIFDLVPFASVNKIDCTACAEDEAVRYAKLLQSNPPDVCIMGIGENGHIAFNDPPVADFSDKKSVKKVKLDQICRQQQVNDGCFESIDQVPEYALSLTVPVLFGSSHIFCIVPASTKAAAVAETLNGSIDEHCPASILRKHNDATMYLDADSSALLK